MSEKIGIYGGSFDPVHTGHLRAAEFALSALSLSKLIIIPAFISPLKGELLSSPEDRLNMCRLGFSGNKFEVSDIEIKRGGKSYTIDTLTDIQKLYGNAEFYLLMGSDQLLQFHKWYRYRDIADIVNIVSFARETKIGTKELEDYCEKNLPSGKWQILNYVPIEISSTKIRNEIKNSELYRKYLLPQVFEYIKEKRLYCGV